MWLIHLVYRCFTQQRSSVRAHLHLHRLLLLSSFMKLPEQNNQWFRASELLAAMYKAVRTQDWALWALRCSRDQQLVSKDRFGLRLKKLISNLLVADPVVCFDAEPDPDWWSLSFESPPSPHYTQTLKLCSLSVISSDLFRLVTLNKRACRTSLNHFNCLLYFGFVFKRD